MELEVLGPIKVRRSDGHTFSPSGLQAVLLGILSASGERPVSVDKLVDAMWGDDPDDRAAHRLQTHVHRLRQALGSEATIASEANAYSLKMPFHSSDAQEFDALLAQARNSFGNDPEQAAQLFRKALHLWRGAPYGGLECAHIASEAQRLEDMRVSAYEELYSAELSTGRYDVVAAEMPALISEHPLRERLYEQLMTAHAAAGRPADALAVFRRARNTLVEELGVDPGASLQDLESKILHGESVHSAPLRHHTSDPAPPPAQLPAAPVGFVGRKHLLGTLDHVLGQEDTSAGRIAMLTGGGGAGKTALALYWAHESAQRFPDGNLYADLRGFGPDAAVQPSHTLAWFLMALGVETDDIPASDDERAALFRSKMATRRMLVVLDNARDAHQVRPLLPGSTGSAVLITSRSSLEGLAVREGARHIPVDLMSADEAQELICTTQDADIDPGLVETLMQSCARLPLALRIAAERLRLNPPGEVAALLNQLHDEQLKLDLFDSGDSDTSVRSVFSWSYQELSQPAGRLFRLVGTVGIPDVEPGAAASMTGLSHVQAHRAITELVRAHLVERSPDGRIGQHDLLRSYAAELAYDVEGPVEVQQAFHQLCDHLLATVIVAIDTAMPEELRSTDLAELLHRDDLPRRFSTADDADAWLTASMDALILSAERASHQGPASYTTDLSRLLKRYLDNRRQSDCALRLHNASARAARQVHDVAAEAKAQLALAVVEVRRDRYDQAEEHLKRALPLFQEVEDYIHVASVQTHLGGVCLFTRRVQEAIDYTMQGMQTYQDIDHPADSFVMGNLGVLYSSIGQLETALHWCERALEASSRHPTVFPRSAALREMTQVLCELGRYAECVETGKAALDLATTSSRVEDEAITRSALGYALGQLGHDQDALDHMQQAVNLGDSIGSAEATALGHMFLGETAGAANDLQRARNHFQTACESSAVMWHLHARSHAGLGHMHRRLGEITRAIDAWETARSIYADVGHPAAADIAELISAASSSASTSAEPERAPQ